MTAHVFRRPTAVTAQIWRSHPVDVYIFFPARVGVGAKCGDLDPLVRVTLPRKSSGVWETSLGESRGGTTSRTGCSPGGWR